MNINFITSEELDTFRRLLLEDITELLKNNTHTNNEWLRCKEVRKMLKISGSTLQNLRISGKIKFSKIGGIHFYRLKDIQLMLDNGG